MTLKEIFDELIKNNPKYSIQIAFCLGYCQALVDQKDNICRLEKEIEGLKGK